jgi:signal transduction histidine kinase
LLAIVLLAFAPFAIVVSAMVQRHTESARAGIIDDRLAQARAAAHVADSYIDGRVATLVALSQLGSVQAATPANANEVLGPVLAADPTWLTLALSDAQGLNITSFSAPARTVNISDRDYFQQAMTTAQPAVGSVITPRGTLARKTVVIATPIRFADGSRGALSGALALDSVEDILREALPAGLTLLVVDRTGREFIGPQATSGVAPLVANDADVRLAMPGGAGATVLTLAGVDTLVAYARADDPGWSIMLEQPAAAAFAVPDRDAWGAVVLTLTGLGAALVLASYFGRRLTRSYAAVDRARAEAETERARLSEALRHAPAQVGLLLGPDLVFAVVSPDSLGPLGLKESDVIGKPYREVDPDPGRQALIEEVFRTGRPRRAAEAHTIIRLPSGATREAYFNSAILPLRDADGQIDGVVYHAVDVTDLVQARQRVEELVRAVAAERDELQQLINTLPEAIVLMRADGSTVRNHAAAAILGDAAPLAGDFDGAGVTPAGGVRHGNGETHILRALRRGDVVHGEQMLLRNASGGETPILASAAPVRRDGKIVAAVAVFQDISALKAIEAQRTEFFSVASHEIKTPITAIQLQLDLAQRLHEGGQHARVGEMLRRALTRTRDLAELVNDLLTVSRIDAGRFGVEPIDLDLATVARDAAENFPTDETHPIRVSAPATPVVVRADRRRIVETVENLLSNAVKYSPEGGAIDIEVCAEGGRAVLRVRDHGIGVPPEEHAYIFERFFRTSRARSFGGVGLGLYISREIVERHGGSLELESSSEGGSTFTVALPLAPASRASQATSPA